MQRMREVKQQQQQRVEAGSGNDDGGCRRELLLALAAVPGIYVPQVSGGGWLDGAGWAGAGWPHMCPTT